jgi:hypothetical protein
VRSTPDEERWLTSATFAEVVVAAGTQIGAGHRVNEDLVAIVADLGLVAVLDGVQGPTGATASVDALDAVIAHVRATGGEPLERLRAALAGATSAVVALVEPERIAIANIGACHAFRRRDDGLLALACDASGLMRTTLEAGDRLILCSDGVHRTLSLDELETLARTPDAAEAVRAILDAVANAAGTDNASVIVADRGGPTLN